MMLRLVILLLTSIFLGNSLCQAAGFKIKNVTHLFDIMVVDETAMNWPTDVAVNDQYIVVADGANQRILVFSESGKYLYALGGVDSGLFNNPVGVSLYRDKVYVADTGNHAVKVFSLSGKLISSIDIVSEAKPERPIDLVVSNDGKEMFVTCNNTQKVQVYDVNGKLLRSWGKKGDRDGSFRYPATIANFGSNKNIVVDVLNARAQVFSASGKYLRSVGSRGVVQGKLFRPKGVAVDEKNWIYISDSYMDVIQVFDDQGTYMHILGIDNNILRFTAPGGIAIYDQRLYVVEVLANKVSVYSLKE